MKRYGIFIFAFLFICGSITWLGETTVGKSQSFFLSQSFWSMVQSVAIFASLIFIIHQVRLYRDANMLQTLRNMRQNWRGNEMMNFRRITCNNYLSGMRKIGMAEGEVLGFFENMGLLLKKGVVSDEFIWEAYSYYIDYYWPMLEHNINEFRQTTNDNSWYNNFQSLRERMRRYGKKRKSPSSDKTVEEIRKFIRGELEVFTTEC